MKKLFFVMAAVAALLTSCSKDDTFGGPTRGKVTFEVSTPELATRAYGDGTTADSLYYAVYDVIENTMVKTNYATTDTTDDVTFGNDLKATVTIDLVEGRPYEVAFWAESANSPYTFDADDKIVSYNTNASLTANNEDYDAFFAYVPEDKVKVGQVVNVDLKRPFAQLNIATNDTQKATELGVEVQNTAVTVSGVYTAFNLATGAVEGNPSTVTFASAAKADGTIGTDPNTYDLLSMNYVLVNSEKLVDVVFNFSDKKGKADYERTYADVHVQRNYRTNIIGAILTDPTKFDVEIKPGVDGTYNEERGNSREVSTVDEINAALNTLIKDSDPDNDINSVTLTGDLVFGSTSSASLRDNSTSLTTRAEASTDNLIIPAGISFTIDLNGYNITGTDNNNNTNFGLIHTNGTLNIINSSSTESTIKLTAINNRGWNAYSSVISNNPGGLLTVGANVVIEHLGGTDMAYGIDNLTNGKGTYAETVINGGTVKSTYRAIRQFLNGTEAQNILTVNGGTIEGANKSIWMQDPNKNANTGKLTVGANAQLKGDVYLSVTEGSTEWPVEVSIAASALDGESEVMSGNVPEVYAVVEEDGVYKVIKVVEMDDEGNYHISMAAGLKYVFTSLLSASSNETINIIMDDDIDLEGVEWPAVSTNTAFVLDGSGHSIKNLTTNAVEEHGFSSTAMITSTRKAATIKNVTFDNANITGKGGDNSHGAVLVACNYADLTIEGVTVKNSTVSNCDRSAILTTYLYFTSAKVKDCVVEECTIEGIGTCGAILGMNNSHNFEMTNNQVIDSTISSSEGSNKAGIFIGTWQDKGTLTESDNTHSGTKAINAGEETNNTIGRHV